MNKPKDSGKLEQSVSSKLDTMNVTSDVSKCKHPDVKAIGGAAAAPSGAKLFNPKG